MAIRYLDWAAGAPPDADLLAELARVAAQTFGNPSSLHEEGAKANDLLEQARERTARAIGCMPSQVVFTASGSESNNIALLGLLSRKRRGTVVLAGIEHPSVYEPAKLLAEAGFTVKLVPAESDGAVSVERFSEALDPSTALAALMLVNNETGAIQPVGEIAEAVADASRRHGRRIHFHSDCVQALGKIPLHCGRLGVDSASFSGHKVGAPRGTGILYVKRELPALLRGGGQEGGLRPGTENVASIWATALACERRALGPEGLVPARALRALLVERLGRIPGCRFAPAEAAREPERYSPYIVSVSFPPIPGEVLVRVMSDRGFAISTGSACSSRDRKRLRVLQAMGVSEEVARSAVRVSFGYATREEEIEELADELAAQVGILGRSLGVAASGSR